MAETGLAENVSQTIFVLMFLCQLLCGARASAVLCMRPTVHCHVPRCYLLSACRLTTIERRGVISFDSLARWKRRSSLFSPALCGCVTDRALFFGHVAFWHGRAVLFGSVFTCKPARRPPHKDTNPSLSKKDRTLNPISKYWIRVRVRCGCDVMGCHSNAPRAALCGLFLPMFPDLHPYPHQTWTVYCTTHPGHLRGGRVCNENEICRIFSLIFSS